MKMRRLLSTVLPLFAVLGVTGGGFATWYFVVSAKSGRNQASVTVTKKMPSDFGTMSLTFGEKGKIDYAPDGVTPKLFISQRGVEFPSPISLTFNWNKDGSDELPFSSFLYSFKYKISLRDIFSSYFQFYLPTNSVDSSIEGYWYGDSEDLLITDFSSPIIYELKFSLGYKDGMTPNTFEDYEKIREFILLRRDELPLVNFEFSLDVKSKGGAV